MAATSQPPQLSCTVDDDGVATIVRPRGELDLATVDEFRATVDAALAEGVHVVIDLAHLTFIDSTGLQCLLAITRRARRAAVGLELLPGRTLVMRLFAMTDTLAVLPFRTES